jgi:hypothetical protein
VIEDVGWPDWRRALAELLLEVFANAIEIKPLGVEFDAIPQFYASDGRFRGNRGVRLPVIGRFAG